MNRTTWVIVIIVIVVIILFLVYKYVNKKPKATTVVSQPSPKTSKINNPISVSDLPNSDNSDSETTSEENETNTSTNSVTDTSTSSVTDYDAEYCNSLAYRQKLSLLGISVQQLKSKYDIAVINYNNLKNDKNIVALNNAFKNLKEIESNFIEFSNRCPKT